MKRRDFVRGMASVAFVSTTPACALLLNGGKSLEERDHTRILWGYLIFDLIFTGPIGVIIDFASGAIYARKSEKLSYDAREVDICDDARETLAEFTRARQAKRYLRNHLANCPHCSHAFAHLDEAPARNLRSLISSRGDLDDEIVKIQLAGFPVVGRSTIPG